MVLAWLLQFASLTDKEIAGMPENLETLELDQYARACAKALGPTDVAIVKRHLRREESNSLWGKNARRAQARRSLEALIRSRKVRVASDWPISRGWHGGFCYRGCGERTAGRDYLGPMVMIIWV
jgi:hypothetical protein